MGFREHSVADASFVSEVMDRKHLQVKIRAAANGAKISYFIERKTRGKRISRRKQICSGLFATALAVERAMMNRSSLDWAAEHGCPPGFAYEQ
jgi:hypothetical protein